MLPLIITPQIKAVFLCSSPHPPRTAPPPSLPGPAPSQVQIGIFPRRRRGDVAAAAPVWDGGGTSSKSKSLHLSLQERQTCGAVKVMRERNTSRWGGGGEMGGGRIKESRQKTRETKSTPPHTGRGASPPPSLATLAVICVIY